MLSVLLLILIFQVHCNRLSTVCSRGFYIFGPSTWNDLQLPFQKKPTPDSFRSNLKTFLFPKSKPAMFSAVCGCLSPPQNPVYYPFRLVVFFLYCTRVEVSVCVDALRIVSPNKILYCRNTLMTNYCLY